MGNVLEFPKDRIAYPNRVFSAPDPILKSNEDNIRQLRIAHVNSTIEQIVPIIFRYLIAAGFDLSDTNNIKEGAFIVESLRSALLKLYEINHPFQKLSNEIFEKIDDDMLKIVTKLNIELEPEEEEEIDILES